MTDSSTATKVAKSSRKRASNPNRGSKPGERRGGRKRGTPNKRTEDLVERLSEAMGADWCPIVALARIADDPGTSLDMRVRCLSEVAPYLQPKRRAIEHGASASLEDLMSMSLADEMKAARERVAAGRVAEAKPLPSRPVTHDAPASASLPPPAAAPVPPPPEPLAPPVRLPALDESTSEQNGADFEPYP